MDPYAPLAEVYDDWSSGMTEDIPFYADLAREADGQVVELAVVAASLRPGGRFAWNAFAFDHAIAARLDEQHQDEPVPHSLHYAVGENRVDISLDSGGSISLWWATRNEWLGLIDVAGLEVEALYGSFDKRPFDDDSREYVWVARKPE